MSNTTTTTLVPTIAPEAPVLPELDPALGEQLGDEFLLESARTTRVSRVKSHGASAESRAWTMGGRVD